MVEKEKRKDKVILWMRWGIILILLLSGPLHFAFEGLGRPTAAAAILPVNESVFEHLKLAFWPLLFWWIVVYALRVRHDKETTGKWLLATLSTLIVSPLFMTVFYYSYTGAFGFHSLFLDVLSLPISLLVAHILAVHLYRYAHVARWAVPVIVTAVVLLIVAFTLFTYQPPQIPLFMDSSTGRYGLK